MNNLISGAEKSLGGQSCRGDAASIDRRPGLLAAIRALEEQLEEAHGIFSELEEVLAPVRIQSVLCAPPADNAKAPERERLAQATELVGESIRKAAMLNERMRVMKGQLNIQ